FGWKYLFARLFSRETFPCGDARPCQLRDGVGARTRISRLRQLRRPIDLVESGDPRTEAQVQSSRPLDSPREVLARWQSPRQLRRRYGLSLVGCGIGKAQTRVARPRTADADAIHFNALHLRVLRRRQ